jgi:hypothetical protein
MEVSPRLSKGNPLGFDCGALIICVEDDLNLGCIIDRLRAEGVLQVHVYTPDFYYSGRPIPNAEIEAIASVTNSRSAQHVILPVSDFDGGREEIETRIWNSTLEHMAQSFEWSLIVDPDELWVRGSGWSVANAIKSNPQGLSLLSDLIPYFGFPAFPIKTNSGKLLVGIRNDERLRSVRSVCHPESTVTIATKLAHSFSYVRKTPAELMSKIRSSGYCDDQNYDFEGWFRDVLPNIKPGCSQTDRFGVQMFANVAWEDVIHASIESLMEIPDELGEYLGDYEKKPRWNPRSISLLAPSRWRPEQCIRNIQDNWLLRAKRLNDIELIIAVDADDETAPRYLELARQAFKNVLDYKIITDQHQSMTQALETAAKASTGDILISVFDDFEAPHEWDVAIKARLRDQEGKCLFVYDEIHPVINTLQTMTIMTRRCYQDWGYCWYSKYFGMYGDRDYSEHCLLENRAVWALDLRFAHHHYTKTGAAPDRTYLHGNAREKKEHGRQVLAERRACRFQS